MDLEIVVLRDFPTDLKNVSSLSMTADLKLISVLNKNQTLKIFSVTSLECNTLEISDILLYAWQEAVSKNGCYRIMSLNSSQDITCFDISVNHQKTCIVLESETKWEKETIFKNFISSIKDIKELKATDILKYESKEAVIAYNGRYIVTFFLSISDGPRIILFTDICETGCPARKMLLVKETVFILNRTGKMLYLYSITSNSKVLELDLTRSKCGSEDIDPIDDFIVSLEKDLVVLHTESSHLYYMVLGDRWDIIDGSLNNFVDMPSSIVTAFMKQFPSIQPVSDGLRRLSYSALSSSLLPVLVSNEAEQMELCHMALFNGKLCLLFSNGNQTLVGIHHLGSETATYVRRLSGQGFIVAGSSETFPLLLVLENKLSLLLYDIEHNKLINELMIYQCGRAAESLSQQNHWQNIRIDIEVLKQGLRNRQLDAIKFFLKTHQERFSQLLLQKPTKNSLPEFICQRSSWVEIMDFLLSTSSAIVSDRQAYSFSKELLKIATSFAIQLLNDLGLSKLQNTKDELSEERHVALTYFSMCVRRLRKLLCGDASSEGSSDDSYAADEDIANYNQQVAIQWREWDKKVAWKDIVEESLLSGNIALGQSYFLNHQDVTKRKFGMFDRFCQIGLQLVNTNLRNRKIPQAVAILTTLGISVDEKLHNILKNTYEGETRGTLTKELMSRDLLTKEDETLLNFASIIEELYPCTSFQHAKQLQKEKYFDLEEWYRCSFKEVKKSNSLVFGDLMEPSWNNCETGAYCRIILQWLSHWDQQTKDHILVPQLLKSSSKFNIEISPMSVWTYLLENGDLPLIQKWISNWADQLFVPLDNCSYPCLLTSDMINYIKDVAPKHISELALNELARFGIFSDEEQEDMPLLLSRIGKSQCDLNDLGVFSLEKSTLSFNDLCHRIIHYCLDHDLMNFMFRFAMQHYHRFKTWPSCDMCNIPLLKVLKAFCIWFQSPEDSEAAFHAIVSTAELLYNLSNSSFKTLLLKFPPPLSVAMLLFSSQPLNAVVQQAELEDLDIASLKDSFRSYPSLYDSLFSHNTADSLQEVAVYHLLQGNSGFDLTKLFGWQSTNVLRSDESLPELPHFQLEKLSDRYGLKETLTHFYYLMDGRPNFAYLKFIVQEIISGNQISYSRIRLSCKQVLRFALSNFKDEKICSSCVTFLEMLGQDSLPLRTCLINARTLLEDQYRKCAYDNSKSKIYQEISLLFQNALVDKESANKIINFLEAEIFQKTNNSDSNKLLFDNIISWMPVITLANFYDVPVGESYLSQCAAQDDWLRFLVFAQVFQLPKDQVLKNLPHFLNPCIGNHLSKALVTEGMLSGELYQATKVSAPKKRDLRKSLYSRIGFDKEELALRENVVPHESTTMTNELNDETMSLCSIDTTASSDPETGSVLVMKDLFLQLLYSHGTENPWMNLLLASLTLNNPILSVLAAWYTEADLLCCFTIWLMTALPEKKMNKTLTTEKLYAILSTWTEEDFQKLIVHSVQEKKISMLCQGFSIFLPDSPLFILMEYLRSFIVYKKFDLSEDILCDLQNRLSAYEDGDNMYQTLIWVEDLCSLILKEVVVICRTSYERQTLLRQLSTKKLFRKSASAADFNRLYNMLQLLDGITGEHDIESFLLAPSDPKYVAACWRSVRSFLQSHKYAEGRKFAETSFLPLDDVLLLQLKFESEEMRLKQLSLKSVISFWRKILHALRQNNLKLQSILEFFMKECDTTDRYGEKSYLMQIILSYKKQQTDCDPYEISILTRNLWFWFIKEVEVQQLSPEEFDALLPSVDTGLIEEFLHERVPLEGKTTEALEKIIYRLLAKNELNQAFEVTKLFDHNCQDLTNIKLCLGLARGEVDVENVDIGELGAVRRGSSSARKKSISTWASCLDNDPNSVPSKVISSIQKLCNKMEGFSTICEQILVNYSVAIVLNRSYDEISCETNSFVTLRSLLSSTHKEKFDIARSFIDVHELKGEKVASFLSVQIYSSIQTTIDIAALHLKNDETFLDEDEIYNPTFADHSFQLTVKLCQDPSLLGRKLMQIVISLFADYDPSANTTDLLMMVALCICAHNCFTAACNVDGISIVLQKSKKLVNLLAEARRFSLMVTLLTGIGRYGEMKYVFDQLHEHNQIESQLLKRRMRKVPHLKLALLDYLKRCPSSDNYYSALVHSFNMEREIAQDREISARKNLALFCKESADPNLKKKLMDVMKDLVAAAENYCQADCLLQAQLCAELVNLVALQVHLFDSGTWIIGLDETTVTRYIKECNQFSEAFIIAEAYKNHRSWNQAVSHNVIINGNRNYFQELQLHLGISESLIEDISRSYLLMANKSEAQVRNMKWVLSHCENMQVKYELALQLGFDDLIQEISTGEHSAFLQDLVETSKPYK